MGMSLMETEGTVSDMPIRGTDQQARALNLQRTYLEALREARKIRVGSLELTDAHILTVLRRTESIHHHPEGWCIEAFGSLDNHFQVVMVVYRISLPSVSTVCELGVRSPLSMRCAGLVVLTACEEVPVVRQEEGVLLT